MVSSTPANDIESIYRFKRVIETLYDDFMIRLIIIGLVCALQSTEDISTFERVKIAFGSCANEKEGSSLVWNQMGKEDLTALVLLGDTPYIDTTDLEVQRKRYKEFAEIPAFAQLVSKVPLYSTWDDHDFGRNDTDGNLAGKENSRQAFMENRNNPSYGENDQGIYTKFSQGDVTIFLLDTRWFAKTEGNANNPTLLGSQQWKWLDRELDESTTTFNVIACGMVFNNSVRPGKSDCWGKYPVEYARLLSLIKKSAPKTTVLVGGDVHWSRLLKHETKSKVGYDVYEFITSPIHEKLIQAANPPDDRLLFSKGEVNAFLIMETVENQQEELPPQLRFTFTNKNGDQLYQQTIVSNEELIAKIDLEIKELEAEIQVFIDDVRPLIQERRDLKDEIDKLRGEYVPPPPPPATRTD